MFEGYSIKKISEEIGICIQTSFRWRHKILNILENRFMNDKLSGIVEIDETFVLNSHKGEHIIGIEGRKRGGASKYRGQSREQTGILVAIDRKKNVISQVYGYGKISTKNVKDILKDRIKAKSILITDVCRVYNDFTNWNNFKLIKIINEM